MRISRDVARYTGQAELAQAIQEGLEACTQDNEETARLLAKMVDVIDPATGMVWLKRHQYGRDST